MADYFAGLERKLENKTSILDFPNRVKYHVLFEFIDSNSKTDQFKNKDRPSRNALNI